MSTRPPLMAVTTPSIGACTALESRPPRLAITCPFSTSSSNLTFRARFIWPTETPSIRATGRTWNSPGKRVRATICIGSTRSPTCTKISPATGNVRVRRTLVRGVIWTSGG